MNMTVGSISAAFWSPDVCVRGRSAGSFPEMRLVIKPTMADDDALDFS